MSRHSLRNTWIICKHECIKRIRTRSFLITTFLMPLFLAAVIGLPAILGAPAEPRNQRVALVCPRPDLARDISDLLERNTDGVYRVSIEYDASPATHRRLLQELSANRLDGIIWIDDESIRAGRAEYERRGAEDFMWQQVLRDSISSAFNRMRLVEYGLQPNQVETMLRGAEVEARTIGARPGNHDAIAVVTVLLLATMLFITLLSYGVVIMRSVLEEKSSRVIEVLLCAATPDELMSGKILGVGAAGMLQVSIWGAIAIALARTPSTTSGIRVVPLPLMIYFAIFYLLGYLLYSAMFAAVGAAFNSNDEAQHWTFAIISPLILASTLITPVAAAPNSTLAVITSLVPFCSPVLMYMRLSVERPPGWQIALCFAFLIAAIYVVQRLATQIYRVGILMYGKRPTVTEIIKWLSYA